MQYTVKCHCGTVKPRYNTRMIVSGKPRNYACEMKWSVNLVSAIQCLHQSAAERYHYGSVTPDGKSIYYTRFHHCARWCIVWNTASGEGSSLEDTSSVLQTVIHVRQALRSGRGVVAGGRFRRASDANPPVTGCVQDSACGCRCVEIKNKYLTCPLSC